MSKIGRFMELEGLRGVAAIGVVLYHFGLSFYTLAFWGPGVTSVQNMRYEHFLHGNPAMVFLSGTFSVAIFFVLSGFVLSIGFFQTGKLEIIKKLAAKAAKSPSMLSTVETRELGASVMAFLSPPKDAPVIPAKTAQVSTGSATAIPAKRPSAKKSTAAKTVAKKAVSLVS